MFRSHRESPSDFLERRIIFFIAQGADSVSAGLSGAADGDVDSAYSVAFFPFILHCLYC